MVLCCSFHTINSLSLKMGSLATDCDLLNEIITVKFVISSLKNVALNKKQLNC